MSENNPPDMSQPQAGEQSGSEPTRGDWRELRREERQERRERRRRVGGGWIVGAVLIVLGIVLLLENIGVTSAVLANWWALFILIPAFGAFAGAYRSFREGGSMAPAIGALIGGVVLTLVSFWLLFGLDFAMFGPIVLIVIGVAGLITIMGGRRVR